MTESIQVFRSEFIKRYQDTFNQLFTFNAVGECIVRHLADWEVIVFSEMNLPGWSADLEIFQQFLDFISPVAKLSSFVLTEVESVEKFTETQVVFANRDSIEKLWIRSRLPHFTTVCFDESARWCALFNNHTDRASLYRVSTESKELGSSLSLSYL